MCLLEEKVTEGELGGMEQARVGPESYIGRIFCNTTVRHSDTSTASQSGIVNLSRQLLQSRNHDKSKHRRLLIFGGKRVT